MAGRVLNRRELRRQSDAAELAEPVERAAAEVVSDEDGQSDTQGQDGEKISGKAARAKAKPKAAPKAGAPRKPRAPRKPKAAPRVRARWAVCDSSMKHVAVFDYKDRAAAEARVVDLIATRKTGSFFLQLVKDPMPEGADPALGAC